MGTLRARARDGLAIAATLTAALQERPSMAQPDLPPPPPPPLGQPSDVPSLPPPPAPPATQPSRSAAMGGRTRKRIEVRLSPVRTEVEPVRPPPGHPVAVTWNPIDIGWGRLSVNVEVLLAPHHAVIVSPNVLVFHANRGAAPDLLSEGFGFASPTSFGIGGEVGYHYWLRGTQTPSGVFVGPSLLFGGTTLATVGDASHMQGYWGFAVDGGIQEVVLGALTAGIGAGVGFLDMAGTTAFFPRFLVQIGWSF